METLIVPLLAVLVLLVAGLIWIVLVGRKGSAPDTQGLVLMQSQLAELTKQLDAKLSESRREMNDAVRSQFSESQKLLREISRGMQESLVDVAREQVKTNEATTRFMSIAEQLVNLEKVLKHQKQRGNLGEASLELILSNILPPGAYKMQHRFKKILHVVAEALELFGQRGRGDQSRFLGRDDAGPQT
jgi:hypothetical protein